MNQNFVSIRPFVGATDFQNSKDFYTDLGFEKIELSQNLCLFKMGSLGFYLQDAFVKDWIDNTMVFVEVENVTLFYENLVKLNLTEKYKSVRIKGIREMNWGKECFVHDPSGILWHFGEFNKY
jgi:catechol 2,3-dioxygenase-like lactoylglutathione lyase family enzyme